jgi:hypothetical protein
MSRVKKEDNIVTSLVRIVAGSSTGAHKKNAVDPSNLLQKN